MVSNTPSPYRKLRSVKETTACSGGTNFPLISAIILEGGQLASLPGRWDDRKPSRSISLEKHTRVPDANSTMQKSHLLSQAFLHIQRKGLNRRQCPPQRGNKPRPVGRLRRE